MLMMTNALLVYRLTGSGAIIGLVTLTQALPQLLIGLLGGAIADRVQKKYILIFGQIALAVLALAFAVVLDRGYVTSERWWLLLVLAACEGSLLGFLQPASFSIIPEIVGAEKVMNAISLASMGQTFLRLIGPSLAGFLIDAHGFPLIYYLMSGLYVTGWVFSAFLPKTQAVTDTQMAPKRGTLADMSEGFRYLRRDIAIMLVIIFGLLHVICGMPFMQLMSIFTEDILQVGATGLGILTSVSAVGSLASSVVMASLPNRRRGLILLLSGVIMGLAVTVFAWSRSWYLSLAVMPLAGLGPTMHMTMTATLIQYYAEPNYRGRMQSFVTMSSGLAGFGTFVAGVLSEAVGVQLAVGGMAILLIVISLLFMVFARKVMQLE
jgi:MFS family permease